MGWLLKQGNAPDVIPNGSLLMSIRHSILNLRIIDSMNFLPMALAKLPACFGLTELKKGYFPHLFNNRENQTYIGPLPAPNFYSPECMSTSGNKSFQTWYATQKDTVFDFQKEMYAYCK